MMDGFDGYLLLGPPQAEGAGIMPKLPQMGQMPNMWGLYFEVASADESAAQAQQLGGRILQPAQDIPGVGRFATVQDPQGAVFGILQSSPQQ
jgi:predicted enzyme related to lactoylglutathione lyase